MALSVNRYRHILLQKGATQGQAVKLQSDMVMEATWDRDIQSRLGYIYDYYSDDSVGTMRELEPQKSNTKVPVAIKFIVVQHSSLNKDQVEYQIQFKPSHKCPLDYYKADYDYRYGMEYPVGMYIDIPDEGGVYRKWLICSRAQDPQFLKYSILPCNYTFRWAVDGQVYVMDGVARLRNSYNSGIWTDYLTTTVENQDQLWLPLNETATTIFYNQRFLISAPIPTPIAWRVSKVETIHPIGIYKVVVTQDLFDAHRDFVDLKKNVMIADYYVSAVEPEDAGSPIAMVRPAIKYTIESSGKFSQLRIGGSAKTFRLAVWNLAGDEVSPADIPNFLSNYAWSFSVDGEDVSDRIEVLEDTGTTITIQTEDLSLLSSRLLISVTAQAVTDGVVHTVGAYKEVEVIAL